ncbi:MAG: peptidase domain-containing ABC transporter [Bacteroidetes bacterium]|nr:peptidase domain-containing ABC transporter [Bacteroidota bacterium]
MRLKFPHYTQLDAMDCGPTCVRMIAKHYGKALSIGELRSKSFITRGGVSMLGISEAAAAFGLRTLPVKIPFDKLKDEAPLPCIVHWNQNHFVVVYKIRKGKVYIADPDAGLFVLKRKDFEESWLSAKNETNGENKGQGQPMGVVLLIEPTAAFYEIEKGGDTINKKKIGLTYLFSYLNSYRKLVFQLCLSLLLGSLIQLLFPFLTQSVVDVGINTHNLNFIYLVLIGQLMLTFSRASVEFIRGWILIHLSARINISIISDFLIKLMQLPMSFFDQKMTGDILRRIDDHSRIERFLSSSSLNILFSFFNLIVFSSVLIFYSLPIFFVMMTGSMFYVAYTLLFMKKRAELDYKKFNRMSQNQNTLIQIVQGMQEIKLNNCEHEKRWWWERVQAKLFQITVSTIRLQQWQEAGSLLINETKNVIITIMAAKAVLNGDMSLGMMLSVQYIIGQTSSPINQFVSFIREYQDAKLSLERIGEIHSMEEEDGAIKNKSWPFIKNGKTGINVTKLSFQYEGPNSAKVLDNVELFIPKGKVTAVVGASGSGKTTLMKLLLKFYQPVNGEINVDGVGLSTIHSSVWRNKCGAVIQDGFIFADTIMSNVTMGDDSPDLEKLSEALRVANIIEFVQSLPLGLNTKIGGAGTGISEGQKQRILIARAVYKNPEYLFFDEATSSLDANNEKMIMQNLEGFYKGRTVLVIAHRLSTVRNADQIVVLSNGKISEYGTHEELTEKRGVYYELVKNQLELGR